MHVMYMYFFNWCSTPFCMYEVPFVTCMYMLYAYVYTCHAYSRLTIHNGKAKMCFFREFILRLDGNSDMDGMYRVGTAGSTISSIMSNPQTLSRPSTTLSLPKIVQPIAVRTCTCTLYISNYTTNSSITYRKDLPKTEYTVH